MSVPVIDTPAARLAMPSNRSAATVALAFLTLLAGVFFRPVFEAWGYLVPPLVGAVVVALVVAVICDRLKLRGGEAVLLNFVAAALVLPGLLNLSEAKFGLPLPGAMRQLVTALVQGPAKLLTSPIPARSGQELLAAPILGAWAGFVVGWLCVRKRAYGWSVAGPVATLGAALAFGPRDGRYVAAVSVAFLASALIYLVLTGLRRDTTTLGNVGPNDASALRRQLTLRSAAVLMGIVGVSAVVGPRLPGVADNDRFTLRHLLTPPFDSADLPSPLAEFRSFQAPNRAKQSLLSFTGDSAKRWRLAVLPAYDGRVWSAGAPTEPNNGVFELIGARLAKRTDLGVGTVRTTDITVDRLAGPWLPTAGPALTMSMSKDEQAARATTRYNTTSGSLVLSTGSASKLHYELTWLDQPEPTNAELEAATFAGPGSPLPIGPSSRVVGRKATEFTAAADTDWEKVSALRSALKDGYFTKETPPGHSIGDLARMVVTRESMQGSDEHYAALFATLGRALNIPTRVVVGFVPNSATKTIHGSDVKAWPEVNFVGLGWVPIDITIDPSKRPKPKQAQAVNRAEQTPTTPNTIPSPEPEVIQSAPRNKDSKDAKTNRSFQIPAPVIIGAVSITIPCLLVAAFVGVVVALKGRRRRRRRSRSDPARAISGAWEELRDRATERGMSIPRSATLAETGRTVTADFPQEHESVNTLLDMSERAAYHPVPPTAEHSMAVWSAVDSLTVAFGSDANRWDRLKRAASLRALRRSEAF